MNTCTRTLKQVVIEETIVNLFNLCKDYKEQTNTNVDFVHDDFVQIISSITDPTTFALKEDNLLDLVADFTNDTIERLTSKNIPNVFIDSFEDLMVEDCIKCINN
jgi:hypothetical protein